VEILQLHALRSLVRAAREKLLSTVHSIIASLAELDLTDKPSTEPLYTD
jgi:hypothetical protein